MRARVTAALALGLAVGGCHGVTLTLGGYFLVGLGGLALGLAAWRGLIGPGRFDRRSRLLTAAAEQAGLPLPSGAQAMQTNLPSGLAVTVTAPEHLELQLRLPEHLPAGVGVDRPGLPPGQVLEKVSVPASDFSHFMAYGPEAETLSVLDRAVRGALEAERRPGLHVAIERGALRVRLGPEDSDLVPSAFEALDTVARVVVQRPRRPAARLLAIVRDDEPPMRQAALRLILTRFPESEEARAAAEVALADDLDGPLVARWSARRDGGALSLAPAEAPSGGLALADDAGRLSSLGPKD